MVDQFKRSGMLKSVRTIYFLRGLVASVAMFLVFCALTIFDSEHFYEIPGRRASGIGNFAQNVVCELTLILTAPSGRVCFSLLFFSLPALSLYCRQQKRKASYIAIWGGLLAYILLISPYRYDPTTCFFTLLLGPLVVIGLIADSFGNAYMRRWVYSAIVLFALVFPAADAVLAFGWLVKICR